MCIAAVHFPTAQSMEALPGSAMMAEVVVTDLAAVEAVATAGDAVAADAVATDVRPDGEILSSPYSRHAEQPRA